MADHYMTICKYCNVTISQCRCPSKDKKVIKGVCEGCIKKNAKEEDEKDD